MVEKKATFERHSTKYPGVFIRKGTHRITGKPEDIFYIRYRRDGKRIEEKVGREKQDDMTAARASKILGKIIDREQKPRKEQREAIQAAKEAKAGKWTFDKLWSEWKKVNANKKSIANDGNRYQTHLQGLFGNKEPKEVTPFEVDRLRVGMLKGNAPAPGRRFNPNAKRRADYSEKKKKELAARTVKREKKPYAVSTVVSVLSLLRRIASFGADRRLCGGLSFKVIIPKGAKQKTEDMSGEQMARYIRTCREWPDPQAGNFQLLEILSGIRRAEARNLKWSDVDFDRGFIILRDPKSGEDERIPMNDAAAELLEAHPKEKGSVYVFAGKKGGPRGLRQIVESSGEIRDVAGLPKDFRPNHGLRHTFASHLASSGEVDLYTLQKMMTHKSPQMTQRYAHLTDAALKRGSNVMSRIVAAAEQDAKKEGAGDAS
jgi:integrase